MAVLRHWFQPPVPVRPHSPAPGQLHRHGQGAITLAVSVAVASLHHHALEAVAPF